MIDRAHPSMRRLTARARECARDVRERRDASATSAYGGGARARWTIDSHSLIKQLRSAQFTEPQAEGVVRATVDAMTRALLRMRSSESSCPRARTRAQGGMTRARSVAIDSRTVLVGDGQIAARWYNIDASRSQKLDLVEKGRLRELPR